MRRILAAAIALASASAFSFDRPNLDVFVDDASERPLPVAFSRAARARIELGQVAHFEQRLGVPTFFWASRDSSSPLRTMGVRPEQAARRYLFEYGELYRAGASLSEAPLVTLHDTGVGAVIASFRKEIGGVPVFRDQINVVMDQGLRLVAITGYLSPHGWDEQAAPFSLAHGTAVALAVADLVGAPIEVASVSGPRDAVGEWWYFDLNTTSARLNQPSRARKVLFGMVDRLEPAYHVEIDVAFSDVDSAFYAYVVSARDGRVLFRKNLTNEDAFTYRVWADPGTLLPYDGPQGTESTPHPTGKPDGYQAPFVPPVLVTLQNGPISTNDPWLPSGASETVGNNVDAYADRASPDGFNTGDVRATVTGPNTFDRIYDTTQMPSATNDQISAAVTQLFYVNNFLHDWFYDHGFDEKSFNAQHDNYGRGGLGNDRLRAEAQDYSGRNNANMSTPADGSRPRMQMYVFSGVGDRKVTVTAPSSIARDYAANTASFGPRTFNVAGDLVLADDGAAPNADACSALVNDVAGKIVLIDRGTCTFAAKVKAAQNAGAIGVIIANNTTGSAPALQGSDSTITIGALSVSQQDGTTLKNALAQGSVAVTLMRQSAVDRDGTLDNAIVAHEWGHYISNRLIGNSVGLSNLQGGGMGEGWGDFHALLMVAKKGDEQKPNNANWSGVYGLAAYTSSGGANNGYYFGIRRLPYSVDFTKNALTFKHIQNGVPLPSGVPTAFGASGANNAEVHNTGEVWATMLWECYVSLLRATTRLTFEQAQSRMLGYLVAAYKATPNAPTFLEARDALLAAAYANDVDDFSAFAQAFARRGAGAKAVAPDRSSFNNSPVVESFVTGGDLKFATGSLDDQVSSCDKDGFLDHAETGRLKITLKNVGTGALSQTTGKVTTTLQGVTFSNGGVLTFSPSQPYGTTTATLDVGLRSPPGPKVLDLKIEFTDPGLVTPGTLTHTLMVPVNVDVVEDTSAADDVESPTTTWTVARDQTLGNTSPWRIHQEGANHLWFGPNPSEPEDSHLVSPPLDVGTSAFSFTFKHRWDFETENRSGVTRYYDGGVIEISADGGATWTDIGSLASPGYNATLDNQQGSSNPLRGRQAFAGKSPGWPSLLTTKVDLGTTYAGKTVKIRFRIGADDAAAATGWEIDDLSFTGITNTPFPKVIGDRNACTNRPPVAHAGDDRAFPEGATVQLSGSGSTDPDGDPLTFAWTQTGGPAVTLSDPASATPSFVAPEVAADEVLTFQLVVDDMRVKSAPAAVRITVLHVNKPPVASAGPDQVVAQGTVVTLDGTGSADADGDPLTHSWSQLSGTPVTLSDASAPRPTFEAPTPDGDRVLVFSLTVSDGYASSAPATAAVLVNRAPVADGGPRRRVRVGETVELDGTRSSDPDGDSLSFEWSQIDGAPVELSSPSDARPTFTAPGEPGLVRFSLVVSDGHAKSEPATVEIEVVRGCGCTAADGAIPFAALVLLAALRRLRRR